MVDRLDASVYRSVVRTVYRIERWEAPTAEEIAVDGNRRGRWVFLGQRDRGIEDIYLYRVVSRYLGRAQNPVRLVNCAR
jgi:hypothetical protein